MSFGEYYYDSADEYPNDSDMDIDSTDGVDETNDNDIEIDSNSEYGKNYWYFIFIKYFNNDKCLLIKKKNRF